MAGETTPDAAQVERHAREMGWVPQDQFRGASDRWVDAETFVKRGEEVMPILKANNKRLETQVSSLTTQLAETTALVQAGQEAIAALKESQTAFTKAAIQRTKTEIRSALRAARESNDMDAIESLEEQLDDIRDAEREVKAKPTAAPAPAASAQPRQDPEFIAWQKDNTWFGKDNRRTALMLAEAQELRGDTANASLQGRAFYEKAAENADAILSPRTTTSKVETGGSGPGSSSSGKGAGEGKKSYRDLPADAKAVCDRQADSLVGPGRAFKTKAEWQENYAEQFFQE